jgi:hypothetical protein
MTMCKAQTVYSVGDRAPQMCQPEPSFKSPMAEVSRHGVRGVRRTGLEAAIIT